MKIVLASASKRRQEFLTSLKIKFRVVVSHINEKNIKIKDPEELVQKIAYAKAMAVYKKIKSRNFLIISADTIVVVIKGQKHLVFGKPQNRQEAETMLKILNNRMHRVLTAVVLLDSKNREKVFIETTKVYLKKFSTLALKQYLDQKLYLDRAGAYGIQDPKFNFVKEYQGSYTNIMGLPIERLKEELKKFIPRAELCYGVERDYKLQQPIVKRES